MIAEIEDMNGALNQRQEMREKVKAEAQRRGISMAEACRQIGVANSYFWPSANAPRITGTRYRAILRWLEKDAAKSSPPPVAAPLRAVELPELSIAPGKMDIGDFIAYLQRLQTAVPGARVSWGASIFIRKA